MKFLDFLKQAVAKLGLESKFAAKELSPEEQKSLIKAYEEASGSKFSDDLAAYQAAEREAAENQAMAEAFKELASVFGKESASHMSPDAVVSDIKKEMSHMKQTIETLGRMSQGDEPEKKVEQERINISGAHTKDYAFGIKHPMFSAQKRWNKAAICGKKDDKDASYEEQSEFRKEFNKFAEKLSERYAQLVRDNSLSEVKKGTADYSLLKDAEIGTQYFIRRMDALIARIDSLPSLSGIFPTRSNIQDGDVLTNVLFKELSQAYQKGHISKGGYKLEPEKAKVHKVMMKYLIEDMSWIEESYLGYLNTSGSDPVKWSMIEWLVLCIAEQLNAEQIERDILGYRVEPKEGESGMGMFASTGVVHRLISYYDEHKVLPFDDEDIAGYNKSNIGDVLEAFMDSISEKVKNVSKYAVYVNEKHKAWYKAWYTAKYGTNADFSGVRFTVPNHENEIIFVPGMRNLKLIFATIPGNIQLLEFVPGERNKLTFQRDLEAVWVCSYWKSGVGVTFSGAKKDSIEELKKADGADQMIFMNWPAVTLAPDTAELNGKTDIIFRTGANTKETVLTDITDAQEDMIYRIELGDSTHPSKIDKTGKFDQLTSAWAPSKTGEYIKLYYKDGKFYDVDRG